MVWHPRVRPITLEHKPGTAPEVGPEGPKTDSAAGDNKCPFRMECPEITATNRQLIIGCPSAVGGRRGSISGWGL